jgi:iturin family lipopeptide synthetase A
LLEFNKFGLNPSHLGENKKSSSEQDMAIIGVSVKFPYANDTLEFWDNLCKVKDCIRSIPKDRAKDTKELMKAFGMNPDLAMAELAYLDEVDKFDYPFFNLSPKEASLMDPNQRLFLETAWQSFEDAGYSAEELRGSMTGIFLGYGPESEYKQWVAKAAPELAGMSLAGNTKAIIASRLSYILDLHGPSMLVDTTCSSSLVAVHLAIQAIRNGECDMALAGGIQLHLLPVRPYDIGIEAADGRTKTFSHDSDGTGTGEGAATILIKPLAKAIKDKDSIYAVIKGSAVNHDGKSNGITAPSAVAQEDVLAKAWENANIDPETISYIEAHGTGTKLGDPIEIDGISRALRRFTKRKNFVAVGSVKSNIGHLDNSAGIAGLVKAILSLKHKKLPPTLHFKRPNEQINFIDSPVYVNDQLKDWNVNEVKRRCGVSSFGLSGTNCHVVLEEAPEPEISSINQAEAFLLPLSAGSEDGLKRLLNSYLKVLKMHSELRLQDLCYTASQGRGHYQHRMALVVKHKEELISIIDSLCQLDDFESNLPVNVFYEKCNMVGNASVEFDSMMESHKDQKNAYHFLLNIGKLYAEGKFNNWEVLYQDLNPKRVNLPTYPFERHRCWVELKQPIHSKFDYMQPAFSPLLDRKLVDALDTKVFSTILNASDKWMLQDHKIGGECVFVGTAYLEMVSTVFRNELQNLHIQFKHVLFLAPLIVKEEAPVELHLVLKTEEAGYSFYIASAPPSENDRTWTKHVQGNVTCSGTSSVHEGYAIEALKTKLKDGYFIPNLEEHNETSDIYFGPRWSNIQSMYVGESELLSRLEVPIDYQSDLDSYVLYPPLLDNALATNPLIMNAVKDRDKKSIYLPLSYRSIHVIKSLPSELYSYVTSLNDLSIDSETLSFDICLMDKTGSVVTEIKEYTLKRLKNTQQTFKPAIDQMLYELKWIPQTRPESKSKPVKSVNLIVTNSDEQTSQADQLRSALLEQGHEVISATISTTFSKLDNEHYNIRCSEADCLSLLQALKSKKITRIYQLGIQSPGSIQSLNQLEHHLDQGVRCLYNLTKAWLSRSNEKVEWFIIANGVYDITGYELDIYPEHAAMFGLAKVIDQEYSHISCRCIDIDEHTPPTQWIKEFDVPFDCLHVAYRKGQRMIEQLTTVNIREIEDQPFILKENGVYLITGGRGGIGLNIAKHLSQAGNITIALLNRSSFPPRAEWLSIIESDDHPKLTEQVEAIQDMESNGATISIQQADVSSEEELNTVLESLRATYGPINGIIHSAGMAGNGFLIKKDSKQFEAVLQAKIQGTWLLDKLTSSDPIDFLVLCASNNTLVGIPGQGDYTAANCYLNAFASWRNRQGRRTISINWPAWEEVGMAAQYGVDEEGLIYPVSTQTALELFDKVMTKAWKHLHIADFNPYGKLHGISMEDIQIFSEEIRQKWKRVPSKHFNKPQRGTEDITLTGSSNGSFTNAEQKVAELWQQVLGFETFNITDDFFEIGGDSISATFLLTKIKKVWNIDLSLPFVFQHTSIQSMAEYLEKGESVNEEKPSKQDIQLAKTEAYYPVSQLQYQIYVQQHMRPENTHYNLPKFYYIHGLLDPSRLLQAFQEIVKRHEVLRTTFKYMDEQPVQIVHKHVDVDMSYDTVDYSEEQLQELFSTFVKPFNLTQGPLFRVKLLSLNKNKHVLLFDIHHIVSDGTSLSLIVHELASFYQGNQLPVLEVQYKDYAVWQKEALYNNHYSDHETYWLSLLEGDIPELALPTDFTRPAVKTNEGAKYIFYVEPELKDELRKLAIDHGATLFMILLAAYYILLSKYSGQSDIIVGTPSSGRNQVKIENNIGMFVNMLPLRQSIHSEQSFEEFLSEVKERAIRGYEYQDYPLNQLVSKLGMSRNSSRNPLYDTAFVMQNMQSPTFQMNQIEFIPYELKQIDIIADIELEAIESEEKIMFFMKYWTELYTESTIQRMADDYVSILFNIVKDSKLKIKDIQLVKSIEKQNIFTEEIDFDF